MIARKTIRTINDPVQIPGMPLRFSKREVDESIAFPNLDRHNEEVLSRLLNYSQE